MADLAADIASASSRASAALYSGGDDAAPADMGVAAPCAPPSHAPARIIFCTAAGAADCDAEGLLSVAGVLLLAATRLWLWRAPLCFIPGLAAAAWNADDSQLSTALGGWLRICSSAGDTAAFSDLSADKAAAVTADRSCFGTASALRGCRAAARVDTAPLVLAPAP